MRHLHSKSLRKLAIAGPVWPSSVVSSLDVRNRATRNGRDDPRSPSATVNRAYSKDVVMAQPLDGSLGNGEGHVAKSAHAACHRFVGLAEYHRQSCPGLFRYHALGTRGTERALLQ